MYKNCPKISNTQRNAYNYSSVAGAARQASAETNQQSDPEIDFEKNDGSFVKVWIGNLCFVFSIPVVRLLFYTH